MANHRRELTEDEYLRLQGMAAVFTPLDDCAAILTMSNNTLIRRLKDRGWESWAEFQAHHGATQKARLRQKQIQEAMDGNVTMLIFLGKVLLGQREVVNVNHNVTEPDVRKVEYEIIDAAPIEDAQLIEDEK